MLLLFGLTTCEQQLKQACVLMRKKDNVQDTKYFWEGRGAFLCHTLKTKKRHVIQVYHFSYYTTVLLLYCR